MSQLRSQPVTGVVPRRRIQNSSVDRRTPTTPLPAHAHGPPAQIPTRRAASATTNFRDRPKSPPRTQSSERPIPTRKPLTNFPGKIEQPAPKQQPNRHEGAGNLVRRAVTASSGRVPSQSPGNKVKRPPFVAGSRNTTTYRGYAATKTESRCQSSATSSKDRRALTGCAAKESMTELKRPPAAHGTETMTLLSGSVDDAVQHSRDRAETPDKTESSPTVIVADPLPEVFIHRANRKQHHPSADECIKQVAEKLSEFAAIQNGASNAVRSETTTFLNASQRTCTGNDNTTTSYHNEVPIHQRQQDGHSTTISMISGGNDVSTPTRRVSRKTAETYRNTSARLTASTRPSPTRSSLLRQALNCPASSASQPRGPRPTPPRPTGGRTQRPATELGADNHPQTFQRQQNVKQGRVSNDQIASDAAAQPKNAVRQTSRRLGGSQDARPAAATTELRHLATKTTTPTSQADGRRSIDALSSRTYNVVGESSTPSSVSTPRTYVVEVLPAETDDESSRQTSPRIADKLARNFRRRRPKSFDNGMHSRLLASKDGELPEVGYSSHHSSSTETFAYSKSASVSSESLRRRRRKSNRTPSTEQAGVASSTPNLQEIYRMLQRRRSSGSSEGEVMLPSRAEPVEVQVSCRQDAVPNDTPRKKSVSDHRRTSRLPRLVTQPQQSLPSTSSVSATVMRAPRPRSFRYSRLHRRAVDALVPPPLRDMPWRWAWRANTAGTDL